MLKLLKQFSHKLPKYLIAAIIIIVPLFPKFPLISVPGTYVAIRFEDLLLLMLGIVTAVRLAANFKKFIRDDINRALVLLFVINLISVLSAIIITKTAAPHLAILNYARRLEYLVPFMAVLTLFKPQEIRENLGFYIKIFILVTVIAFIYGLGQRYLSFPIIITQNDQYSKGVALRWTPGSHISSTFAGHYDLAAFMVLMLPLFLVGLFMVNNFWSRLSFFAASGAAMWLLINSLARISQLSYLVAITIALTMAKKFKALFIVLIISILLIGQSPGLKARFKRVIEVFYQKVTAAASLKLPQSFEIKAQTVPGIRVNLPKETPTPQPVFEDRSTSIRLKVEWPRAIRAFRINPLLGTGYSSIGLATDNDFLRMIGETGILGFAAFMLVFLKIGRQILTGLIKTAKFSTLEYGFLCAVVGGVIGTFVGALFIDLLEASKFAILFWFMLGYALALAKIDVKE